MRTFTAHRSSPGALAALDFGLRVRVETHLDQRIIFSGAAPGSKLRAACPVILIDLDGFKQVNGLPPDSGSPRWMRLTRFDRQMPSTA